MKLVIVESPTKAKTLNKFLSNDYVVKASMGHIRDLPKSGLAVDVEHNFEPEYVVPPKAKKTLTELKKAAKDTKDIILATDPDREGEAIAWHLRELLTPKNKKEAASLTFTRAVFHELTKEALDEAFKNQGDVDMNLVDAQQARRVLDRLVGYKLSPLLWKKVMYGLSAGRVQSVAVRLVVEREKDRKAFNPEEYWDIKVDFTDTQSSRPFKAELFEANGKKVDITKEDQASIIVEDLKSSTFIISDVKKAQKNRNAYPPLKTSTLQQVMANVYGFNAKRTMKAAQGLFEEGYITYHRTDSLNLSKQFIDQTRSFIGDKLGKEYIPQKPIYYKNNSSNAQEAHEAIRPTNVLNIPSKNMGLGSDEFKVYSIIWKRSLESQMESVIYDQTTLTIRSNKLHGLRANGSVIRFDGWMGLSKIIEGQKDKSKKSKDDNEEEIINAEISETESETVNGIVTLPEYSQDEVVLQIQVNPNQHFTQPPARYSDASLIKKLEELGVGRPSTYAPTLTTIQQRGYVEKDGRYFVPKDVAYVVSDLLVEHFPEIVDYNFTASMEKDLDEIAEGNKKWVPVIKEFYEPFDKKLSLKDKQLQKQDVTNLGESDEKCPECGKVLVYKLGKFGKFLSCSGYPDCKYAKPLEGTFTPEEESADYGKCPNCEDGVLVLKQGRFGKFLACSNYPKCKTTKPYLEKTGQKCPKCGEGDVVVKKGKYKKFFGCSRYPDCDWSSWTNPSQDKDSIQDKDQD